MIKYNDSNDETKVIGSWWKYEVHFKFTFTKKINIFDICLPTIWTLLDPKMNQNLSRESSVLIRKFIKECYMVYLS